uniref:GCF C-terminal domain-containing protein n=1 Tax=Peronospora matthiolae TaxID=2874970 RepID=A0AAV1T5B2_9STRA
MFRRKTKSVGAGGKKRREVDVVNDVDGPTASVEKEDGVADALTASAAAEMVERDLHELEQLRGSRRSRTVKSVMTFSSKSVSSKSSGSSSSWTDGLSARAQQLEASTRLSFEDGDETAASMMMKKRKMRPNVVVAGVEDVAMETEMSGRYSAEMMATLRSEQSVLLSRHAEMDVILEGEEENAETEAKSVQDGREEEDEFIALDGDAQMRRSKNRVTFSAEVQDPSRSEVMYEGLDEEGEEEEEQNRRWEEELMRRAGHRVPKSLDDSTESTSFELERASRDFARLEAETALVETALVQQQEELRVSSEEFEYFQDVEDFVRGLSSCLRAKVPVIEAARNQVVQDRARRVKDKQKEEQCDVVEEMKWIIGSGKLDVGDIMGLNQLNLQSSKDVNAASPEHTVRFRKYQAHFIESYVTEVRPVEDDLFGDAIDEFKSLERVYGRFQEWKAKFPQVYKDVFCELAQEKLFAPYVQAELLYWDPLGMTDAQPELGKAWSLDDLTWYQVLRKHLPKSSNDDRNSGGHVDSVLLYQIRHVLLENVRVAVSSYYDPYSSLQVRSLSLLLEEIDRQGYSANVEGALQMLVNTVLEAFASETKRTVLVALDQNTAMSSEDVIVFARYLLEKFATLQDNLLTLFVALPRGPLAASAFGCLLQVLHHLLAYVRLCRERHKTQLVAMATQVIRQLSGSSYVLQLLSDSSQERELRHILDLFDPFLQPTAPARLPSS